MEISLLQIGNEAKSFLKAPIPFWPTTPLLSSLDYRNTFRDSHITNHYVNSKLFNTKSRLTDLGGKTLNALPDDVNSLQEKL